MTGRTDGNFRRATVNAASHGDDIDAGWDTISSFPPTPALTTTSTSPPPASAAHGPTAPPCTGEIDLSDFRPHQVGGAAIVAAIGAAVALIVGSVGSDYFPNPAEPPAEIAALRPPKESVPEAVPRALNSEPPPSPMPRASGAVVDVRDPLQPAPAGSSREAESNAVAVIVKVTPARAVIFRAGEKLGAGTVQVRVEPGAKQRLTALHDGYTPYNFTLDGTRDTVTVQLKRAPNPPAATRVSDSPPERPNDGSTGTVPPPSSTTTAPESIPQRPPSPDNASSGETPAQ